MALHTRRDFKDLKDDHLIRVGMNGSAYYSGRAKEFLAGAYFDLAALFHHPELDANAGVDIVSGVAFSALPSDAYVLFACNLLSNATLPLTEIVPSEFKWAMEYQEAHVLMADFSVTAAAPKHWSRHGDVIIFKAQTDADYTVHFFYYRTPTQMDFGESGGETTSELAEIWDERILELSVLRAKTALWRPDLAMADSEMELMSFYQLSGYPLLREHPLFPRPARVTTDSPHGGSIT